ncbi:hypothetical protein BN2475_450111 [Paraburkholderia ribeironis]|uniref:Uncharacterized protein n=1 Tax=Paraburkholderia ribeironis TaxID=1247936 RepID=A0A1N7S8X2_9BURK|nr:hypothetical protein BN2475_450111 [Paraburkholderia ribeironis]
MQLFTDTGIPGLFNRFSANSLKRATLVQRFAAFTPAGHFLARTPSRSRNGDSDLTQRSISNDA